MKTIANTTYTFIFTEQELKLLTTILECTDEIDDTPTYNFCAELFSACEGYLWQGGEQ